MLHTLNSIPMPTTLSTPSTPTKNTKYTNSLFCHKENFVANSRSFCDTFYVPKYCGGLPKITRSGNKVYSFSPSGTISYKKLIMTS